MVTQSPWFALASSSRACSSGNTTMSATFFSSNPPWPYPPYGSPFLAVFQCQLMKHLLGSATTSVACSLSGVVYLAQRPGKSALHDKRDFWANLGESKGICPSRSSPPLINATFLRKRGHRSRNEVKVVLRVQQTREGEHPVRHAAEIRWYGKNWIRMAN